MLLNINYADGRTFSLGYSNIIILVLANMAIFGSLIYTLTINKPWIRIAILPLSWQCSWEMKTQNHGIIA